MPIKVQISIFIILIFIISSCSSSSMGDIDQLKEELNLASLPTQADYPDADAIILDELHDVKCEITEDYNLVTEERVRLVKKLFKNIEKQAFIEINIYDGEELEDISGITIKTNGQVVPLKEEDFYTLEGQGEGSVFYSDKKSVRFTFPAIEKDCIVEYEFTKRKQYAFRRDEWRIQHTIPTLRNTYQLTVPTMLIAPPNQGGVGWNWRYRSYNYFLDQPQFIENMNHQQSRRTANVTYKWELKNIEPIKLEDNMPPFYDKIKYVKFSPHDWENWNDISEWYNEHFFKPQCIASDAVVKKAEEISQACETDIEKIGALFNYVQKLRYVAIELGEGSIKPSLPETVLDRQYGDCKDKSTLLISMLKSQGIKASPVLLLTTDNGTLDATFPSWNFNHMIVLAEDSKGKEVWLDPTIEYARAGELPYYCENANAMIIDEDGKCKVKRTPVSSCYDNKTDIKIDFALSENDAADLNVTISYDGERNHRLRNYFKDATEEELNEFCKNLIIDDFTKAKITEIKFSDVEKRDENLELSFSAQIESAVQKQGDLYFLNVDPFKIETSMDWLSKEERTHEIVFDYPLIIKKNITIHLPEEKYSIRNIPEDMISKSEFTFYKLDINKDEPGALKIEEDFLIKQYRVPASRYPDLKEYFEKMKMKNNEKLILVSK